MSRPLVSILIPTHNRAESLRHHLPEIQQQAYEPLEILISDNASTDDTEALCRAAAVLDSRIRYVRQLRNLGNYGNHNFLFDQARGDYFSVFHDHDERDPGMITRFVEFLEAHPDVGVVSSNWELIDEEGRRLGVRDHPVEEVLPGLAYIEQTIRSGRTSIGIPGAMVRRSALGDIRFDEQGHLGFGDFVLWFRVAERWQVGHLKQRLWKWRQHPQAQSARTIESLAKDYDENLNRYCDDHLTRWPGHVRLVARWRRLIKRYLFWALAYELSLHLRGENRVSASRSLFEILGYRLSDEEFRHVLHQLREYRTSPIESMAWAAIQLLMVLRLTGPLAWATRHYTSFRGLLGLR